MKAKLDGHNRQKVYVVLSWFQYENPSIEKIFNSIIKTESFIDETIYDRHTYSIEVWEVE